jgi:hypothetical protein
MTTLWVVPLTLLALSVIVSVPLAEPAAVGVKVTLIMQLIPALSELPQVLVSAKSLLLGPVIATLVMTSVALPVLVNVRTCAALLKPTVVLGNVIFGGSGPTATGSVPVPLRLTVWVELVLLALSVIVSVALAVAGAMGLKVTLMLHFIPALSELPQGFIRAKSPPLVPVIATLVMASRALPVLVNVTTCALVAPTAVSGNVIVEGDRLTSGAVPVPLRLTVWVVPLALLALSVIVSVPLVGPAIVGVKVTKMLQGAPAST